MRPIMTKCRTICFLFLLLLLTHSKLNAAEVSKIKGKIILIELYPSEELDINTECNLIDQNGDSRVN